MHGDTMIERLLIAFPPSVVEGSVAPHDCPECLSLREHLSGRTWREVSAEFVRDHPDVLPLLSRDAYLAHLPAWLHEAVLDPDGEVAMCLLVNLSDSPDTTGFTAEQAAAVIEVTRFIVGCSCFGSDDPENAESMAAIERTWSDVNA